jgi:hypothetical protein
VVAGCRRGRGSSSPCGSAGPPFLLLRAVPGVTHATAILASGDRRYAGFTPDRSRQASTDQRENADRIAPTLAAEPTESTDPTEPTEPIDRIDPAEPIDKMEPAEPIDKIDPLEPMLRMDPPVFRIG